MRFISRSLWLPAGALVALHAPAALAFTAEQAAAGRAAFEQTCVTCHGAHAAPVAERVARRA